MARKAQRDPSGTPPAESPLEQPAATLSPAAKNTPAAKPPAAAPAKKTPAKKSAAKKKPAKKTKATKPPSTQLEAMSATDMAVALGFNRRTVHEWLREGCPRNVMGALAWVLKNKRGDKLANRNGPLSGLLSPGGGLDPDAEAQVSLTRQMHAEKLRGQQIDNEQEALALAEKRRDLVSRKLVKRDVATIFVRIKERLLVIPDRFEPRFPAEVRVECKQDFQEFCRLVLIEMRSMPVGGQDVEELVLAAADEIRIERRVRAEALASQQESTSEFELPKAAEHVDGH